LSVRVHEAQEKLQDVSGLFQLTPFKLIFNDPSRGRHPAQFGNLKNARMHLDALAMRRVGDIVAGQQNDVRRIWIYF
jgi:hypothetical protein